MTIKEVERIATLKSIIAYSNDEMKFLKEVIKYRIETASMDGYLESNRQDPFRKLIHLNPDFIADHIYDIGKLDLYTSQIEMYRKIILDIEENDKKHE